jgi:hypothetical protein
MEAMTIIMNLMSFCISNTISALPMLVAIVIMVLISKQFMQIHETMVSISKAVGSISEELGAQKNYFLTC